MSFSLSLFEKRSKERLIERSITLHIYGVLSIMQQTVCCRRILNRHLLQVTVPYEVVSPNPF